MGGQNPDDVYTFNAVEQRIEWGVLLGYRIMRRNNATGFTIDAFISGDIGYRGFNVDPIMLRILKILTRINSQKHFTSVLTWKCFFLQVI